MASKNWQLNTEAAQRYEEIAVSALLGPFAEALVNWANLDEVNTLADIGCGTGVATRLAAKKMNKSSKAIGIDVNEGMIQVAKSLPEVTGATIEWKQESAYALSLESDSVDAVLSAQSLQFMDTQEALGQIRRILKKGQSAYISLWCPIEENPYFETLLTAIAQHISKDTAAGLKAAFNLSQLGDIKKTLENAHFSNINTEVAELHLNLPLMQEFAPKHIYATPMGIKYQAASATTQQAILDDMTNALSDYQTDSGLSVPFRSYLVKATK